VKIESLADGTMKWVEQSDKINFEIYENSFEVPYIASAAEYY